MNILIACIGNIFLGDDGFGVEVARELAARPLPEGVAVKDYGIRALDLAYALLEPRDLTILVDCCARGGDPGTLYQIEPGDEPGEAAIDPHSMNPVAVLRMVRSMGGPANPILIVGCEPADLGPEEGKLGLSEPVSAAVPEAARLIESLLERVLRGECVGAVEP